MALPLVNTIKKLINKRIKIMGTSQYFFRSFKKPHKSSKNSIYYLNLQKYKKLVIGFYNAPFFFIVYEILIFFFK